ncbi:MAG: transcription-repair coupling factor [Anaerotruncus rubiinfantis]|jgi:transcription-repair coupling factor (superfamily II helicase)|uniref:transcription-repair coupling factor n=1 Tax=Anaerotruncus rubiinfantis TaxID=1720200 RepID=UPI00189969DB|nr:transcription-repair coupling factor [Anaerotruncus rubiinfantis]
MKGFEHLLENSAAFMRVRNAVEKSATPVLVTGLSGAHKAHTIVSIVCPLEKSGLVVVPDEANAVRICEDINIMAGEGTAALFPSREMTFYDVQGVSHEYEHARLSVLGRLAAGKLRVVVASAKAALQYTMPPPVLAKRTRTLRAGESYQMDELTAFLVGAGYTRSDQVDGVCQFSQRGGILDFFPPHMPDPFRIEFWGDEIDTISTFKIENQRREDTVKSVDITPAAEVVADSPKRLLKLLEKAIPGIRGTQGKLAKEKLRQEMEKIEGGVMPQSLDRFLPLLYPEPATIFDYMPDAVFFLCDTGNCREALKAAQAQQNEDIKILFEEGVLFRGCDKYNGDFIDLQTAASRSNTVLLDTFVRSVGDIPLRDIVSVNAVQLSSWSGEIATLREEVGHYMEQDYCVVVFAGTDRAAETLTEDLRRAGIASRQVREIGPLTPKLVYVVGASMSAGMEYPDLRLAVISQSKAVSQQKKARKPHPKEGKKLRDISDLSLGDYVVHTAHGIGVFEGIVKRDIQGIVKDYIKIRYAGTDTLFVPVTQLDLVSKYVGVREEANVKLSKLNSVEWQKTRQRVKKAVEDMAKELTELYAKRMQVKGYAFSKDTDWQNDFERRFPYEETDDQLRCIDEIKADMEATVPMDRLLCGDVGFGKTEVALRAAFKCVMDGKQCALLCPTTILAWQHYNTVRRRMEGFPVKIELLSRFRTPKEQKQILDELRRGEIDIIIGTHRLVQNDVKFKDLGLCIIDEEQRFGVRHKEKFKEMRATVDVLNLSATPIPRTLNMAMSGIRDMSILEEAPQDRHPVQTYVIEHDWGIIAQAIEREMRRGGQIFYLHNRVESIDSCAYKLQQLVPDARIVTAHGKMTEEHLSRVWQQLLDYEVDILVCTTIIETGVDVPNCNTLIIEDADYMGLSQLYQIRGRVGRSSRRAFAYLTFRKDRQLSDIATKRLAAIREFTSFGSGFRIAMRDLEIRGAGNILGSQQHGHMEAVGYDMYLRMLSDAVAEQRGETPTGAATECMVDVRVGAHIPEDYIDNLAQRIDIYKKIAGIETEDDAMDLIDELIDRFGEPPEAVKGLVDVALVRNTASLMGIKEISQRGDAVLLYPEVMDMSRAGSLAVKLRGRVMVSAGNKPYITVKIAKGQTPLDTIREALAAMNDAAR